jgi:hypothetical protein
MQKSRLWPAFLYRQEIITLCVSKAAGETGTAKAQAFYSLKQGGLQMLDVVIFEGNEAQSSVENMLVQIRHAVLADNVSKLLALPLIKRVFLVTNQPQLSGISTDPRLKVELNNTPPSQFNFGRVLLELINRHHIRAMLYMGGAAVPLADVDELAFACQTVLSGEQKFVTNNVQSADIIGFSPASVLSEHLPPATDNELAMLLRYRARFEQVLLPATLGTQFDIDTPSDVLVLAASPFGGVKLRKALTECGLDLTSIRRLKQVLCGDYLELALAGRVGAPAIARLNNHFKVRLRVFSEERGMKALGRLESGKVVSLLGYWLEDIGPERFFGYLAQTVQAAMLDTRVFFAHMRKDLSDADRFSSDLGLYDQISDPWLREFTYAAVNCPIPVILGGHSLVAGCVWALTEELGCQF